MSKGLHRLSSSNTSGSILASPHASYRGSTAAERGKADGSSHFLDSIDETEMLEVRKRTWWTLWSLVLWTAYNSGRIPTIRADDPRVRSELPHCNDDQVRDISAL